jgi:hypothetical protein
MVNSCRSDFTFDMRINRYLSPLLWWKSAFEDTFPLDNPYVALWIVRRNLILADAAYSIAGNCR